MFALLHSLAMFVIDFFKSPRRLEAENLFLRHQLSIALRRAPRPLRLRGSEHRSPSSKHNDQRPELLRPTGLSRLRLSLADAWSCHVQCVAKKTTTLASNRYEIINPANIPQPRAFVIAATVSTRSGSSIVLASVAGLLTVASACIRGGASPETAPAPEGSDEDKSPTLRLPSIAIGALRFLRGRGGRPFFMAASSSG